MTGLGQYAAKLNGRPVGDAVLEPGQTSYFAEVNYRTYDVTSLLRQGSNLLGVETGSGAYQRVITPGRYFFQNNPAPVYGAPKTIAQLEITYADGSKQTIASDTSWRTRLGGTTFSSWWSGEDYDGRRQPTDWTAAGTLDGSGWRDAGLVTLTATTTPTDTTPLIADQRPPVTVAREAHPVAIRSITRAALNTTLVAPASAGDTNVKLVSVAGLNPGDSVTVDGETRKVTAVGTGAGAATTVFAPAAAGDTNLKVGSVTGFVAGQRAVIDNEVVVVSAVGTAGTATTLSAAAAAGATNLRVASVNNLAVGDTLLIGQQSVTISSVGTAGANGTGVGITPGLSAAQPSGTAVRDTSKAGTGLTLAQPLASAHAVGATARATGTGVTLDSALGAAHATGAADDERARAHVRARLRQEPLGPAEDHQRRAGGHDRHADPGRGRQRRRHDQHQLHRRLGDQPDPLPLHVRGQRHRDLARAVHLQRLPLPAGHRAAVGADRGRRDRARHARLQSRDGDVHHAPTTPSTRSGRSPSRPSRTTCSRS